MSTVTFARPARMSPRRRARITRGVQYTVLVVALAVAALVVD